MPKQTENHVAMMMAISTARLLVSHYDDLPDDERKEMTFAVCDAIQQLMDFRNIINGMVQFDLRPKDAVLPYVE